MSHTFETIFDDINNYLTYEEMKKLEEKLDKVITAEWASRKKELSDEEIKAENAQADIMQGYADDMMEEEVENTEDTAAL